MPTPYTGSATSSVPFTGDPLIDGLIIGEKWGGGLGTGTSVTYSFPDFASTWSTDPVIGYDVPGSGWEPWDLDYRGLDATQQNAVRIAMQAWGAVANVNPVEVVDNASVVGDIRVAFTSGGSMDAYTYAYTYTPLSNTPYAGDIWLNPSPPVAAGNDFSTGAAGYDTIIHELGHALGLDHPFPDSPTDPVFLPTRFDSFKYTVMSYSDAPGHVDTGYSLFYPTTPMLLDIQAIQYLYGPNMTYHAGDDTYTFSEGVNYYQTIWDAGGIDTIRYNATTDGALIDLRAGQFSQLGNAILLSDGVTLQDDDVAIAFNVTMENAIGGDAGDELIGNTGGNVLDGGAGSDTMSGGQGNDTYLVDTDTDVVTELIGRGMDLVQATVSYALTANVENLTLAGVGVINGTGNGLPNIITGNAVANTLDGLGGADTLIGGMGNDIYMVNAAGDVVTEQLSAGTDEIRTKVTLAALADNVENLRLTGSGNLGATGNGVPNTIFANSGDNALQGGAGADTLSYQYGATAGVTVSLALTTSQATGGSGADTLSGFERLTGSGFADMLTGRNGNNALKGLAGDDTLIGAGGDDVLLGGAGQDAFDFTAALDVATNVDHITDFSAAADLIRLDNDIFTAFAFANVALTGPALYKAPGADVAHDASDRIIYDTSTGDLYYDPDGTGAAAATIFATLTTHPNIGAANFFIID